MLEIYNFGIFVQVLFGNGRLALKAIFVSQIKDQY
jgi:hypothetical protein